MEKSQEIFDDFECGEAGDGVDSDARVTWLTSGGSQDVNVVGLYCLQKF